MNYLRIVFLLFLLPLGACDVFWWAVTNKQTTYEWRQKLTVDVETPEGLKSGSAVQNVVLKLGSKTPPNGGRGRARVQGEAVVVDLGKHGFLFVLLKGATFQGDADVLAPFTFNSLTKSPHTEIAAEKVNAQPLGVAKHLVKETYPLFVTFKDINDPASVVLVNPDDMEATFSPDVKLKRIVLEITDEPVTRGQITKLFKWFGSHKFHINPGWASLPSEAQQAISGLVDWETSLEITKQRSEK
jgi:hypothetical protein